MKEREVELVLQKAKEKYPTAKPRLISDNGPQFIARDFKQFGRISGMDHLRTSPYYPQSNGKIERWHGSLKAEAVRPKTPLSLEDARRVVGNFVEEYNTTRLHSAIGYVTPHDRLEGRHRRVSTPRPGFIPGIAGTPAANESSSGSQTRATTSPAELGNTR